MDSRLEATTLLQNGVLHVCSRSLAFDQDPDGSLPPLNKFRFNSKFDFEVLSGEYLEQVHSQLLELVQGKEDIDVPGHLLLLDYFYKYLLFQTFPEVLSPSLNFDQGILEDYSQILDRSA